MEEYYQKKFKKLTLFFLLNTVLFNGQNYQKQKGPRTRDQLLFRLWDKFKKIFLYVFDQVWWCILKWFLSYSNKYICKFMRANSWRHKLFHSYLSLWICKIWKGIKKNLQKFENFENKMNFFNEIKNIFYNFWRAIILVKNKNLIKNSKV